jgi:large subunit ribosomal protein L15
MSLHTLLKLVRHKRRRGRGHAKGGGKSGRGMKGQKSRAGYSRKAGFEGGQTPLYMRLPKARGSKQKFAPQGVKTTGISIARLNKFENGTVISPETFDVLRLKLIGNMPVTKKLTVRVHGISAGAKKQIEAAGGTIEVL